MDLVRQFLTKYNLTFDEDIVSAAIEEQVYAMNKDKKHENSEG